MSLPRTTLLKIQPALKAPFRSLALIIAAGVLVSCANPAENKPKADVQEPAPKTEAPAASASTTYAITPENSKVSFIGSKVTGSHDGGFHQFSGTITIPGGDIASGHVALEIDVTSIWSDNDRLTGHLKSPDFFEVETYPKSTFHSTAISPSGDTAWTITGNLNLHGVEKSISFPAKIQLTGAGVAVDSEFALNRKDFGIKYEGQPDNLIRDEVVLKLAINATPAGAQPM